MKGLKFLPILTLLTLPAQAQDFWTWVGAIKAGGPEGRTALATVIRRYEGNDPTAGAVLGYLYLTGVVYPRDLNRAWEFFTWANGRGSTWGATWMGYMIGNGYRQIGQRREELQQVAQLLHRAMERGNLTAQALYGALLVFGYPMFPEGPEKGFRLIQEAADKGDPMGKRQLARIYLGIELPPALSGTFQTDPARARALFEKAAAKDYLASGHLAYMLYFGLGGPADPARAVALAKPLVGLEPYNTMIYLLALYEGRGIAQNRAEACRLAAGPEGKQAPGYSAYIQALCLKEAGKKVEAYAYLLKAAGWGIPKANSLLKEWEKELTEEELERAKARFKSLP